VPGLYAEKLQALIKGLPKSLRKQFIPVPNYVDSCVQDMGYANGDLLKALSAHLNKQTSSSLSPSDFELDKLSAHLRMTFYILDEKAEVIAVSEDFNALKRQYAKKAGVQFQAALTTALSSSRATNWQFDDIPTEQIIQHQGQELKGFPALVDEKNAVALTLVDSQEEADRLHQDGLIRLFRLKFAKELKQLSKKSAITTAQAFSYQQLKPHPHCELSVGEDIFDDLAHQLMTSLFLNQNIRTEAEFEAAIQQQDVSVYATGYEMSEMLVKVLTLYQQVKQSLTAWAGQALHKDESMHLSCLFYQGFVRHVPADKLRDYLRFLKAIHHRLEKANAQLSKDTEKAMQVQRFESQLWRELKASAENPELDSFRWAVEEFRISLFAQQIKTKQPVSEKRLEKAWSKRSA
jgi:ATP-dependent helicase HrpA